MGNTKEISTEDRNKIIVRTSLLGILANVVLAGFKAAVGLLANSIAVILDAVNNLTDALSSLITILGTKLANKQPDKKHPLGHGRAEYLSAMVVAAIVLYAGITALVESIKKIIHPVEADYSPLGLVIIAVAVLVKLVLGRYVKRQGEKVNSGALIASGADALFDAILSLSVLASALIFLYTGLSLEAYVGVVISLVIIKAGFDMIRDTVSDLLGRRTDSEVSRRVKEILCEEPEVRGAYDLFVNDYGPNRNYASVHLELPDDMSVADVDLLTRRVQEKVYRETGVILTGVGVYSYNTKGGPEAEIRDRVMETVMAHEWALQVHGFYVDVESKEMRFDVVLSFDVDKKESLTTLYEELGELYPDYNIVITPDLDVSD